MQFETKIIFKASVPKRRADNTQIKYFALSKRECTYEFLQTKLAKEFPGLSKRSFHVSWMGISFFLSFFVNFKCLPDTKLYFQMTILT